MERVWIAYDISDPKRWRRVFRRLHDFGAWRQLSVFEIETSETKIALMEESLKELIDPKADQIIILPVCESCRKGARSIGKPLEPPRKSYTIV